MSEVRRTGRRARQIISRVQCRGTLVICGHFMSHSRPGSRGQAQRRLSQAAGGRAEKPRGLRGNCGFSLPPTTSRLRPVPLLTNHQPAPRAGSAYFSPPSRPSDQMFRLKESNPESIVLDPPPPPPRGLNAASAILKEAGRTVHVSITRARH